MAEFTPHHHFKKIKAKGSDQPVDYLPPKWRAVWFREANPKGTILTEIFHFDEKIAVVKATVTKDDGTFCVSHGHETAADHADYLMKAETKAIGRALAILGYGIEFSEDDDDKEPADPKTYELNQANTVKETADGRFDPRKRNGAVAQLDDFDVEQYITGFQAEVEAIQPLTWKPAVVENAAKQLAIVLKQKGLPESLRKHVYLALTGKQSGKDMDPRELVVLNKRAGQIAELTAVGQAQQKALEGQPAA